MMKFSPHSFLTGADFVLGVLNEWNESTLLWENDLFCIVPLGWLSRLSFKNHFVDFVTVATGTLLPSSFAPTKSFHFFVCFRSPFLFSVCFSLPLRVFDSTETGCSSTTRQMVCEIILSRFSFCVKQRNKGFFITVHTTYFTGSRALLTLKLNWEIGSFGSLKKMKKKTSF